MAILTEKASFVKLAFGGGDLSRNGINIAVRCPNDQCSSRIDGKRKFSIRLDSDQSNCWVCGFKTRNTLIPALRKVCGNTLIQEYVEKYQFGKKDREQFESELDCDEKSLDFPKDFRLLAQNINSTNYRVKNLIKYLKNRNISERDMWYFKIGYSEQPKFIKRVIIPSFDKDGYLNFYTSRTIDRNSKPKYLNADVDKVAIIFNEVNIDWKSELTITEGPFDLMKCNENATCLQGSGLTDDYLLFWRIVQHKTPVILALDSDMLLKSHKFAKMLSMYDIKVKILNLKHFSDVGEMKKKDFLDLKSQAKEWTSNDGIRARINAII